MINSVEKAMKILEIVSAGKNKPITLALISERTGINKSTCSHIVSTLVNGGYLVRISATKGYVLGPALHCLSRHGRYDNEFVDICHPILRFLAKKSGHAVTLAVVESGKKYIIDYIDTESKVLGGNAIIRPDDVYRTATGRILLANMNEKTLREFYDRNGNPPAGHWCEVTSYDTLKEQLANIDKKGIVKTHSNCGNLIYIGYAVAVYRYSQCVGALGLAVVCKESNYEEFLGTENDMKKLLIKARNEINRRMIYNEPL